MNVSVIVELLPLWKLEMKIGNEKLFSPPDLKIGIMRALF